jgi:hypothetical protein
VLRRSKAWFGVATAVCSLRTGCCIDRDPIA